MDEDDVLVFIDGSYFCFYRFTATKAWYSKFTKKGSEEDCNLSNEEYKMAYEKQFKNTITNIIKKFNTNKILWFADSPQSTLWRMKHSDKYKAHRPECSDDISESIEYAYNNLIPKNKIIKVMNAEADDSLGISVYHELELNANRKIRVITGDSDYLQLVSKNVRVYGLKSDMKEMEVKIKIGKNNVEMTSEIFLQTKILMGDKTDGIDPVFKGCGPSMAYKLASDNSLFEKEIKNKEENWKKYQHNRLMIDFKYVPNDIQHNIKTQYDLVKLNL